MKKIISIILGLTLVITMSVTSVYADYQRNETDQVALQNFESSSDVAKWETDGTSTVEQSVEQDAQKNKYMVVSLKSKEGNEQVKLDVNDINAKTDNICIEFDFRIPDSNANKLNKLSFAIKEKRGGSNLTTILAIDLSNNNPQSPGYSSTYWGSRITSDWHHVKFDISLPNNKMRTTFSDAWKKTTYSTPNFTDIRNRGWVDYFTIFVSSNTSSTPCTLYIDNFKITKLNSIEDFGAGESFLNEEMNYEKTTGANIHNVWAPSSNHFVFVVADGSETRNISCISDDGDSNKYMRMNSGDVAARTYFRRSVSATKMFDLANVTLNTNATKSSTAILYQTKLRIDDVTKANTTSLSVIPKLADGSANASERYIFSINPKDGIATVGNGSDIKTYDGLKLLSKQWYTLNLFHNVATGYLRAEIVDNSGNKQVFEGKETDANVDYGYIGLFGFNNSSEEHTVIDFDDLRVYSAAVSDADTFYTLSDFAANKENGTVTATVNVSSDMANVTSGAAKLIIASYKDHELEKLKVADVIPTTGTKTFTLEGIEDGEEVKVMLWDAATNTIVPLYAPITK